jgi:fatty acid desaturase
MENHIKVARAHRALSWLYAVNTILFLSIFLISGKNTPPLAFVFLGLFFGGLFFLHHFTAKGAFVKKPWARNASIGIAMLMLLGVPVGTLIGIYLIYNCKNGWEEN